MYGNFVGGYNNLYLLDYDSSFKDVIENAASWRAYYEKPNGALGSFEASKCFFVTNFSEIPENASIKNSVGTDIFLVPY